MTSPEVLTDKTQNSLFTRTESGEVEFHYFQPFDRQTGEYDEYYGKFPKDEYEKGRMQLTATGSCRTSGYDCTIEITKTNSCFRVFFNKQNKGTVFETRTLKGFL